MLPSGGGRDGFLVTMGLSWCVFGRMAGALSRTGLVRIEPLRLSSLWGWCGVGGGWDQGRPLLENCTVDASIFVVKLVRAHGGCLGTRSR